MKKTLNSVLAFILSVVIVFGGVPIAGVAGLTGWFEGLSVTASAENYSGTCGANLTWQIDTSTGVLTISGTGAMNNWSSGSPVPWSSYRSSITNVTIGSGVTSIGDYAFRFCSKITSITISDSVTSIGDYVFRGCSKLASLVIPNSVTRIGDYAFCSCYRLESITIPGTVTSIGSGVFLDCWSLWNINIPVSVTSIGIRPFERFITVDSDNQYYSNDAYGALFNKDKTSLIQFPTVSECTHYIIPATVTSIGNSAFGECVNLERITIPEGVTSIGDSAFCRCEGLTRITIPDSVTSMWDSVLNSCINLVSVTIGNGVTSIGSGAFYGCERLKRVAVGDSVTVINTNAFSNCIGLTCVILPAGLTSLGNYAFKNCPAITDVYFTGDRIQWQSIDFGVDSNDLRTKTTHINDNSVSDPLPVTDVHISKGSLSVMYDDTEQLTATVEPSDAANKSVTWSTSNEAVATVSASGLVTAKSDGVAIISVTSEDGGFTDTCEVRVGKIDASEFLIEEIPEHSFTGGAITPTVDVYHEGRKRTLDTDYTVSYADNINVGTATVTITGIGDYDGTQTLTFNIVPSIIAVTGIALNSETLQLQYKSTAKLTATISPSFATNKNVIWSSSNADVAIVDANGNVTSTGKGTATITATSEDGGYKAHCTVTVNYVWWQWLIRILLFGWIWY